MSNLNQPLFSSLDDIPSSQIRQYPLSPSELKEIRSLIGRAKEDGVTSTTSSSSSNEPLAGRRVMIPVTSRAFFEGVLQPFTTSDGDAATNINAMKERVVVNVGDGKLVELTRLEASEYFEKQQMDKVIEAVEEHKASKQSSLKKPQIPTSKPNNSAVAVNTDFVEDHMFPFMEIREECDSDGNILRSEIINVSNQMKRLDDTLKQASGKSEGDGKQLGDILAQTLKDGESDIVSNVNDAMDEEYSTTEASAETTAQPTMTVSDAEYASLCSRLEELERLEEEDAKSKISNTKNSKRLQSKGWSKGFLNPKKKNPKEKTVAMPMQAATRLESNTSTINDNSTKKEVSFSAQNEVKEIPRIGQSKVPPRASPIVLDPTKLEVPTTEMDPFPLVSTVPFEENVFRGVVQERGSSAPTQDSGPVEKKKLSRFAMQRLQREG